MTVAAEEPQNTPAPAFAQPEAAALRRRLTLLALPILIELLLSYAVGFFDTWLSGRFGAEATHAVGLAAYVSWLISMVFGLVSTGTTALVSRHWGAQEFLTARRVLNRSVSVALLLGAVLAVFVWFASPFLAAQLGMQPTGLAIAIRYLRFESIGFLFTGLTLVGAAALRGSGDTRTPMLILGSVSIINVVASVALVLGVGPVPALGVDGIVIGTLIARACGGLVMLAALSRSVGRLSLAISEMSLWDETVRRIVRIGIPAVLDGLCMWSGQFLFLMIIGRVKGGPAASAAHMVGVRVEELSYLPALAFGIAASALIGQSLGRNDPETARATGHTAARLGAMLAALGGVVFFFGADTIFRIMHSDPEVHQIGAPAFRLLSLFQAPLAVAIVYIQSLRGAGDTRSPMLITFVGVYLVRLPLAWLFGIHFDGGLVGAWCGMFADVTLRAGLLALRYASGRWLRTEV